MPEIYIRRILEIAAALHHASLADVDVVPVLALERRLHDAVIFYRAHGRRVGVLATLGVGAFVRFQDLGEEFRALVAAYPRRGFGGAVEAFEGGLACLTVLTEDGVEVVQEGLAAEHFVFFDVGVGA